MRAGIPFASSRYPVQPYRHRCSRRGVPLLLFTQACYIIASLEPCYPELNFMSARQISRLSPFRRAGGPIEILEPLLTKTLSGFADRLQFLCHSAAGRQEFRCHAGPEMIRKCMIYKQLLLKTEAIPRAVSSFSLT